MESLPVEMVERLCDYFNVRDLVLCSTVSRKWRRIFNNDSIWRPRCSQNKTLEMDDHLRSTPCVVEPPFAYPEVEETDGFSSYESRWKLAYFREKHLWNNWTNGRFKEREVTRIALNYCNPKNIGFISDDIVYIVFSKHFEAWDVRNVPAVKIYELPHTLTRQEVFSFTAVGDHRSLGVTIGFKTGIRTFGLDAVSGIISEISKFEYADAPSPYEWFDNNHRVAILGTTFIGILRGTTRLHIWDLETCTKLKEVEVDSSQLLVSLFSSYEVTDAVAVATRNGAENYDPDDSLVYIYQIYSLPKEQFFDFRAESTLSKWCRCALLEKFIAILDAEFRVFNFHTSELIYHALHEVGDPECPGWISCCTVGQYFYHTDGYFDPKTKSNCMSFTGTVQIVAPLHELRALGKTCCVESFMWPNFNIFCDLQKDKLVIMKISNFPKNGDYIRINPSCSRLFYIQKTNSSDKKTSFETGENNAMELFQIMQFW